MLRQSLLLTIRRRVLAATLILACAVWLIPSAFAQSTNFNALNALGITTGADTAQQADAFTSAAVSSAQTSARLIAWAPKGITAGETVWLGIEITHQPHWHTYWKNSGDSGLPTELAWTLPTGWNAGELAWPTPKKFQLGPLANYGFDGTVLLPTPFQISEPQAAGTDFTVKLTANWLVCKTECIPEEARFELTIPSQTTSTARGRHATAFEVALARTPTSDPALAMTARIKVEDPTQLQWAVTGLPADWRGKALELFPETTGLIAPGSPWSASWDAATQGQWTATTPLNPFRSESPRSFDVVGPDRLGRW